MKILVIFAVIGFCSSASLSKVLRSDSDSSTNPLSEVIDVSDLQTIIQEATTAIQNIASSITPNNIKESLNRIKIQTNKIESGNTDQKNRDKKPSGESSQAIPSNPPTSISEIFQIPEISAPEIEVPKINLLELFNIPNPAQPTSGNRIKTPSTGQAAILPPVSLPDFQVPLPIIPNFAPPEIQGMEIPTFVPAGIPVIQSPSVQQESGNRIKTPSSGSAGINFEIPEIILPQIPSIDIPQIKPIQLPESNRIGNKKNPLKISAVAPALEQISGIDGLESLKELINFASNLPSVRRDATLKDAGDVLEQVSEISGLESLKDFSNLANNLPSVRRDATLKDASDVLEQVSKIPGLGGLKKFISIANSLSTLPRNVKVSNIAQMVRS